MLQVVTLGKNWTTDEQETPLEWIALPWAHPTLLIIDATHLPPEGQETALEKYVQIYVAGKGIIYDMETITNPDAIINYFPVCKGIEAPLFTHSVFNSNKGK